MALKKEGKKRGNDLTGSTRSNSLAFLACLSIFIAVLLVPGGYAFCLCRGYVNYSDGTLVGENITVTMQFIYGGGPSIDEYVVVTDVNSVYAQSSVSCSGTGWICNATANNSAYNIWGNNSVNSGGQSGGGSQSQSRSRTR